MLTSQAEDHRSSPLWHRIVLTPPTGQSGRWQEAFASAENDPLVAVRRWGDDVAATMAAIVRAYRPNHHEGVAALAGSHELAQALRCLLDSLLLLGDPADVVIVPVTDLKVWKAIAPDAVLVDDPEGLSAGIAEARTHAGLDIRSETPTPRLGVNRLIVIVGCARSGTTWLENLLMTHPQVSGIESGETFVFHDLRALWTVMTAGPLASVLSEGDAAHLLRRYCDTLFGRALHRSDDYFVEKTPLHSLCLPMITEIYPDAWVIHLVRDGRDVASSLAEVEIFPQLGVKMNLRRGAQLWVQVLTAVRDAAPRIPRFREVRYESLVSSSVPEVTNVLEWIGLDVDETLQMTMAGRAGKRVSVHGTTGDSGPGKWQSLGGFKLGKILREAGELLSSEGYMSMHDVERNSRSLQGLLARVLP